MDHQSHPAIRLSRHCGLDVFGEHLSALAVGIDHAIYRVRCYPGQAGPILGGTLWYVRLAGRIHTVVHRRTGGRNGTLASMARSPWPIVGRVAKRSGIGTGLVRAARSACGSTGPTGTDASQHHFGARRNRASADPGVSAVVGCEFTDLDVLAGGCWLLVVRLSQMLWASTALESEPHESITVTVATPSWPSEPVDRAA